jgi:FKBP-type peptidyl-prolyl cis-trans isomerase
MLYLPFSKKQLQGSAWFITGLLLVFSSFFFSGCMKDDSNLDELQKEQEAAFLRQLATDTLLIKQHLAEKNITNAKRTKSGIFYVEQTVGTGIQPQGNQLVKTHYRLFNLTGNELQSSYGKQTYDFVLGNPQGGIYGYREGTSLLKVGGKSKYYIPSGLAYGTTGQPQGNIAPNTILVFEIELLEARNP